MKTRRWYSWLIILAAGLSCAEVHAQNMRVTPEGNTAFSSLKNPAAPRQLETRAPDSEFATEAALLKSLYSDLRQLSRYAKAGEQVSIVRLPRAELASMVCKRPCNVLGFYRNGQIFLDEQLRPELNLYDRSVLLHELMHYFQDLNDAYGVNATCERWYLREVEAYAAQQQFLSASGSAVHVRFAGMQSLCQESTHQAILDKR